MRCHDCGTKGVKLYEFGDARRIIHLCAMCKAEREWKYQRDLDVLKPPPVRKSFWEKVKNIFRSK
jgi:hypothetical protein